MAHNGHVAGPREPPWTLVWRIRGARRSSGWQVMGHWLVGTGKSIGEVAQSLTKLPHVIPASLH